MPVLQAALNAGYKLLAIGLVQFVVKEFRKEIKITGEAGCGEEDCTLQRMQYVSALVFLWQHLPGFMRRDRNFRTHHHEPYALRKIRAHRNHAVQVVTQAENQSTVVGRRSIINVTFNLLCPAKDLFSAHVLPGVTRSQQKTRDHSRRAAAQSHADGDVALHANVPGWHRCVKFRSRKSQSVQNQIGVIRGESVRRLSLITDGEFSSRAGREQRFEVQLHGQPAAIKSAAQIGRRGRNHYAPAVAVRSVEVVFASHSFFTSSLLLAVSLSELLSIAFLCGPLCLLWLNGFA